MMSNWNVPGLEAEKLRCWAFSFLNVCLYPAIPDDLILLKEHQLGRLTQAMPSKLPLVAFNCSDNELRLSRSN